jgi:hypothetical protein
LLLPAAWRGSELLTREDWTTWLTEDDITELEAASLGNHGPGESMAAGEAALPGLGPRLRRIGEYLESGSGATLIRGFPIHRYDLDTATRLFATLASWLGTPLSQSVRGETIFRVQDAGLAEGHPGARGPNTRRQLSFHTDRCDVIGFFCVREARSGGESEVISSVTLFNEMLARRPDLLPVLMQPFLYQRHTIESGNAIPYFRQPIFSLHQGHFSATLLRVLIDRAYSMPDTPDMTELQREALDTLERIANEPDLSVRFCQRPGDILFLNNFVTLHRRTAFEDHPEQERKRLLLRIWLSVPCNRPLDPAFADFYGATEAGTLRGGIWPPGERPGQMSP